LSGIEALHALRELDISHNAIESLDPLVALNLSVVEPWNQFRVLDLSGNPISSVDLFTKLNELIWNNTALVELGLSGLDFSEHGYLILPPSNLDQPSSLRILKADNTGIMFEDLAFLSEYRKLTTLSLAGNQLRTLAGLAELAELSELRVNNNKLYNIDALSGVDDFLVLDISNNPELAVDSASIVENFVWASPDLMEMGISGLAYFSADLPLPHGRNGQSKLKVLKADRLALNADDLHFLDQHTRLESLSLAGNGLSSLAGLDGLGSIRELDLSDNEITDLSPIMVHTRLRTLLLSGNSQIPANQAEVVVWNNPGLSALGLSDIDFAGGLLPLPYILDYPSLQRLEANKVNADLSDLSFFSAHSNLESLSLAGNQLSSIAGIERMLRLSELNISDNLIASLEPLVQLNGLVSDPLNQFSVLNVSNNPELDAYEVAKLHSLIKVNMNLVHLGLSGLDFSLTDGSIPLPLAPAIKLRSVELDGLNLSASDIESLSQYRYLENVSLRDNDLLDVDDFLLLDDLHSIDLTGNPDLGCYSLENLASYFVFATVIAPAHCVL
jgi:hypothetical protein